MKFRWFHIIWSKRFAGMIARARKTGATDERKKTNRIMSGILYDNAMLRALLAKNHVKVRRRA